MSAQRHEGAYVARAARANVTTRLAVVLLALFAILSVAVNAGVFNILDRRLLDTAQVPSGTALDAFMVTTSLLGSVEVTGVFIVAIVARALLRRRRLVAAAVVPLVILIGASLIEVAGKALIHQPSPPESLVRGPRVGIGVATAYSFPSGHMVRSTMIYGLVTLRLLPQRGLVHWPWIYVLLIVLVGYSRVYLGHHWPTDVVGGMLLGAAALAGSLAAVQRSTTDEGSPP
jgi:membrane-associated phospholipid phosphatase